MSTEHERLNKLFSEALSKTTPEERERYLAEACSADPELRGQVDSLLLAHRESGDFLRPTVLSTGGPPPGKGPGSIIDRYRLRERIGEGGCGVVYVADQEEPVRRRVALKVIKAGMDTHEVVARFEAERQALAMMDHPNIAKVLDAGTTQQGRPYFVMELVCGLRITDYCDQNNLSTGERLDLFIKVCQAVQHAHQKGVIHRDLKPSNILVTLHDGAPVPKVIDFGIAKAIEGHLTDAKVYTQLHQFMGTPAYMSPEQAEMNRLDIDTRSDIYSLGVLLYELLAGSTPFDAKELMAAGLDAMRKTIREQEPVRPSTRLATMHGAELTTAARRRSSDAPKLIRQLEGELDWIVMKCLEKDRAHRYETANGLAADLKRHLNNEPVVARPPSTAYRLQKAWRRNRLAFTAAAIVLGALVIGTTVSSWQAIEASRARNAEKEQRIAALIERDKAQTAQKAAESAQQAQKQARLRADAEKLLALNRVVLTLDLRLQEIVEQALLDATHKHRLLSASALVVRPRTGEILAWVSVPALNPQTHRGPSLEGWRNRPSSQEVEPGASFGFVTIAAALEAGVARLDDAIFCEHGRFHLDGKVLHDQASFGVLTVEEAFAKGSWIALAKTSLNLGDQRFYACITNFGFGQRTGVSLPGETPGMVPLPEKWMNKSCTLLAGGRAIVVTQLQMTMAMCAIANGGRLMRPLVVSRIESPEGRVLTNYQPQAVRTVLSPETAREVTRALKAAASSVGTGERAAFEHYTVAGKAGTTHKPNERGQYQEGRSYASFIGFFPAEAPELCISVALDEPQNRRSGEVVAAPVFREIGIQAAQLLNIPPDKQPPAAATNSEAAPNAPAPPQTSREGK